MYKIIGADGKEYGPVSAEVLRQWIAEGRANAQTKIRAEGTTDWKAISEFPEFASSFAAAPPSLGTPSGAAPALDATSALDKVNGPATGLLVVAILGFLGQVAGLIYVLGFAAFAAQHAQMQQFGGINFFSPVINIISAIIGIAVSGVILYGALKMRKLENHGLAMAASIVAMIPCISPCCLLGLPIGIWAITVLTKPEVKSAFH